MARSLTALIIGFWFAGFAALGIALVSPKLTLRIGVMTLVLGVVAGAGLFRRLQSKPYLTYFRGLLLMPAIYFSWVFAWSIFKEGDRDANLSAAVTLTMYYLPAQIAGAAVVAYALKALCRR